MLENLKDKYEMIVVYANVGKENEETLEFTDRCDREFGMNLIWVEAVTRVKRMIYGKPHIFTVWEWKRIERRLAKNAACFKVVDFFIIDGTIDERFPIIPLGVKAKVVDFKTASRRGEPFEASIAKHGIPNINRPLCTREIKTYAIRAYARELGWKKYQTAIGIRVDEIDRMNPSAKKERIIYPLISMKPTKRTDINKFWLNQPFDLKLKGYEGNCDCCWKKSLRKLLTIAKETPEKFGWWQEMQRKYEDFTPASRLHNPKIKPPHRFFRGNLSVADILKLSKEPFEPARDDSKDIESYTQMDLFGYEMDVSNGCTESCEPF